MTAGTVMLQRIDRLIIRVESLPAAVAYYRDVLGLKLIRSQAHLASFTFAGSSGTELILHDDPDLPVEAVYFLVDDVREMYRRRTELKLKFLGPPVQVAKGFRAEVKDPFGTVLRLLDRQAHNDATPVEDARPAGSLFAGVELRVQARPQHLIDAYQKLGRTADDLPYTPHFETLYNDYTAAYPGAKPSRQEVWRHLLNLRKSGKLPRLGEARSMPPEISEEDRARLLAAVGDSLGKRDRLPYTPRFEQIVDAFNRPLQRKLSPHLVWRLVATMAK